MPPMPSEIINAIRDLRFSAKLTRLMKRLCDEGYDVQINPVKAGVLGGLVDSLAPIPYLTIRITDITTEEYFRCVLPMSYCERPSRELMDVYDNLADEIYNKIFAKADESKPGIFMFSKEEALFMKNLKKEIDNRGDFVIDIPKFVDVLFKLGVMIPKEDIETPESDEETKNEGVLW